MALLRVSLVTTGGPRSSLRSDIRPWEIRFADIGYFDPFQIRAGYWGRNCRANSTTCTVASADNLPANPPRSPDDRAPSSILRSAVSCQVAAPVPQTATPQCLQSL